MGWGNLGAKAPAPIEQKTKKQKVEVAVALDANQKLELAQEQKHTQVTWAKLRTQQALLSKQLVELCMFEDADIFEAEKLLKTKEEIKDIKFRYATKRKEIQNQIWHNKKVRKELNSQLKYMQEYSQIPYKVISPSKISVEKDPKKMQRKLNTLRAQLYTNRRYVNEGIRINPRTKDKIILDQSQIEHYQEQISLYEKAVNEQLDLMKIEGLQ